MHVLTQAYMHTLYACACATYILSNIHQYKVDNYETHANALFLTPISFSCIMQELLASTEDEYVEKATALAADLKLLSELRTNLREHLHASM